MDELREELGDMAEEYARKYQPQLLEPPTQTSSSVPQDVVIDQPRKKAKKKSQKGPVLSPSKDRRSSKRSKTFYRPGTAFFTHLY